MIDKNYEAKSDERSEELLPAVVRSLIAVKNTIADYILGKKCPVCGQRAELREGDYTCGWNEYCEQAIGRRGIFCMNCMQITFNQSLEEYKKTLPEWCRAWR